MRKKLLGLEKKAKSLEPSATLRASLREKVLKYTEEFLEQVNDLEASPTFYEGADGASLESYPISEGPIKMDEIVKVVAENVDQSGINPASGGHLGYIPGGGIYTSSLGDYWADVTNRYAGVYFASPGGVRMENQLIKWMCQLMGYPAEAAGNLTSGGSIANLTAIVTARDAHKIKAKDIHKQVIYLSEQTHHCIDKAIHIAGLSECKQRIIHVDGRYRMDSGHLSKTMETDRAEGLKPFLVVTSAGTTDTGAVDPLEEIAEIAEENKAWLHVDAAYGGFFMLTEHGQQMFKGIERSDSVVMDPHKGMFLPYGIGVVLVRDGGLMKNAFTYFANYMQDTVAKQDEISPAEVSPELTKHFRGLRFWLPLKLHGLAPFKAALEEKLLLARYAHKQLSLLPDFEVGPEPDLSVVIFRYLPEEADTNAFNEALVKEIHKDGRIFISSTSIQGKFMLRLAVLSFRTHLSTIDLTLKILQEKVTKLLKK